MVSLSRLILLNLHAFNFAGRFIVPEVAVHRFINFMVGGRLGTYLIHHVKRHQALILLEIAETSKAGTGFAAPKHVRPLETSSTAQYAIGCSMTERAR